MLIWVGRKHWALVLRMMTFMTPSPSTLGEGRGEGSFGRTRGGNTGRRGEEIASTKGLRVAGWILIACVIGLITWLIIAGMTFAGAVVLVVVMLTVYMVIARIVAETGLLFGQLDVSPLRPWVYAMNDLPGISISSTPRTYFWTAFFRGTFTRDVRETLSVYATHAQRIADEVRGNSDETASNDRRLRGFVPALALSLVVAYAVSSISMLYVEYSFAATLDSSQSSPLNSPWAADTVPRTFILDASKQMSPPSRGPIETHSRLGNFGFGLALVGILSMLRLRLMSFPPHPVGFLLAPSYVIGEIWFSVMIGWLTKLILLRFGGAGAFARAKHFFIGLIFAEASAAAFWLIVSLMLNALGLTYHPIRLFPA